MGAGYMDTGDSQDRGDFMKKLWVTVIGAALLSVFLLGSCSQTMQPGQDETPSGHTSMPSGSQKESSVPSSQESDYQMTQNGNHGQVLPTESVSEEEKPGSATLLYQGQASIRIVTDKGKVIYIDPYSGEGYNLAADLILVTHPHFDHNQIDKVENRNPGCQIITQKEAIQNGEHQTFELGFVTVESVEAGYNSLHDMNECVGYVLTFSNGKSVYVTGDTSRTEQMPLLADKEIDYAFFCCDGVYNMGLEEAAECAELVGAKHNIPYHMTTNTTGRQFDRKLAERFDVPNRLIVEDGEEILVK